MTRSWFADLSALELVPDAGPDGPGPLPELRLAVGRWSTVPGPAGGRGGVVRVVPAEDRADRAPEVGARGDDDGAVWPGGFPLVRMAPGPVTGVRLLDVVLTTASGDPAVDLVPTDAPADRGPGAPTWP